MGVTASAGCSDCAKIMVEGIDSPLSAKWPDAAGRLNLVIEMRAGEFLRLNIPYSAFHFFASYTNSPTVVVAAIV
jgi:hypothetical protein